MAIKSLYLVALPENDLAVTKAVPLNATVLITDWQALIDPLSLLRAFALHDVAGSGGDWHMTDRTVEVDAVDRMPLLQAVSDPEIVGGVRRFKPPAS